MASRSIFSILSLFPKVTVALYALLSLALLSHLRAEQPDTLLYSIPAPPLGVQERAQLGYSVAVSDNYAAAGAPYDDYIETDAGVVKVFDPASGDLLFLISEPKPAYYGNFGESVAISGSLLVVGAPGTYTYGGNAGKVYVYDLSSAEPTVPIATLNNPVKTRDEAFGSAVAISGTKIVVGAYLSFSAEVRVGTAYVYDLESATPDVPLATLDHPSPAAKDDFGRSVAISGSRVAIGMPGPAREGKVPPVINRGRVFIYDLESLTPAEPAMTLAKPGLDSTDMFGTSVSLSGSLLVVGAAADNTRQIPGTAYVYDLSHPTPAVPVATLPNPDPASNLHFGIVTSISGMRVLIGAYGAAYIYDLGSAAPGTPVFSLESPTGQEADYFGFAVSISGTRVMVGASGTQAGPPSTLYAGAAYIYELGGIRPTEPAITLSNPGPSAGDRFGNAVAVSGKWVAAAAFLADGNGFESGRVFVFDTTSETPTIPLLTLENPQISRYSIFGVTLAMSGSRLVVGSTEGYAFVYDVESATPTVPLFVLKDPKYGGAFGSVAISGTRVIVGDSSDNSDGTNPSYSYGSGIAYLYDLSSATPTVPVATFHDPSPAAKTGSPDNFGVSVGISGTWAVIGAANSDIAADQDGAAYVYDLSSATPATPVLTLTVSGSYLLGRQVAISGSKISVASLTREQHARDNGIVYIYDIAGAAPAVPALTLQNPDPDFFEIIGYSMAMSGTRLVTGCAGRGRVFVYDLGSDSPASRVSVLLAPELATSNSSGGPVAIDGSTVVLGVPNASSPQAYKGAVAVFGPGSAARPRLISPSPSALVVASINVTYTLLEIAAAGSVNIKFLNSADGSEVQLTPDSKGHELGQHSLTIDAGAPGTSAGISSATGGPIVDGKYTVSISYLTAAGESRESNAHANVTIDSTPPVGGSLVLTPSGSVPERTGVTLVARDWADLHGPLSFQVFVNDVPVTGISYNDIVSLPPYSPGSYTVKVRVFDVLRNFTETPSQTFTVIPRLTDPASSRLYTHGEVLPEAGTNPIIPAGAAWYTFGVPAIDEAGRVAVIAKWRNPPRSSSGGYGSGVFVDGQLRLAIGAPVPGISGAKFKLFKDPVISGGSLALIATIAGVPAGKDTVVIRVSAAGEVTVLAQEGTEAIGTEGAIFKTLTSVSIAGGDSSAGSDGILYTGLLKIGSGMRFTASSTDAGAWVFRNGVTTLAVREGITADGLASRETVPLFVLPVNAAGSPAQGRGQIGPEQLSFSAKGSTGRWALMDYDAGALRAFALTGDKLGGAAIPLAQWESFGPLSESPLALAVRGVLQNNVGGVRSPATTGIFLGDPAGNSWEPVAQVGAEAPLPDTEGVRFKSVQDPVLAPDGKTLAFPATLAGRGTWALNESSLWWLPEDGPLTLLARENSPAVGGGFWKAFISLAIPGGDTGPLFLASLAHNRDGITAANDVGVWAVDSKGELRLQFRERDTIDGKTVKSFVVLKAAAGSPGARRSFNAKSQVVWKATFMDGSTGIVVTTVP